MSAVSLPLQGLAAVAYPQRHSAAADEAMDGLWRRLGSHFTRCRIEPLPWTVERQLTRACRKAERLSARQLRRAARATGQALRRHGQAGAPLARALALAMRAMLLTHGLRAYDTQLQAAWWMLQGHLVEMATGEGKTLAIALAAGAAALSGTRVHVVTANDYLVARDAATMAPFFAALGLNSTGVTGETPLDQRARHWRHAVAYTTARELAFDYLRDHVDLGGERDARLLRARAIEAGADNGSGSGQPTGARPILPGLALALIDEADSVLLDEAVVPLILAQSRPASPEQLSAWRRAYDASRRLVRGRDYRIDAGQRRAELTETGRAAITRGVARLGDDAGAFGPARRAAELVTAALTARHVLRRDHDYVVLPPRSAAASAASGPNTSAADAAPQIQLIDALTGRLADGRQWQGALQPMVELKEGLSPGHPSATVAQITYQRFFPRYLRLGGMSGTLREARHELMQVYRTPVTPVPLARPSQRLWLGEAVYVDARHKWQAALRAVRRASVAGQPVLVGCDSVADARHLSALLAAAKLTHQVLDARQDADEAALVAQAGEAGRITVATNMAGRGTDIAPDAQALRRGGLHVIACMRNRSRRIDRQLVGRAARQGQPGSAEAIVALDDALPSQFLPEALRRHLAGLGRRHARGRVPEGPARMALGLAQRLAEFEDARRRTRLRRIDAEADALYGVGGALE